MDKIEEDSYRYALKNAVEHEGKADLKAVIGKIMALHQGIELKKEVKKISAQVEKVNKMQAEEQKKEFLKFEPTIELKPRPQREGLRELDWAKEEHVVTRFAPNPNAPFHVGNSRAALLSYQYAEMYNGEFILRFDDTDPKIKKSIENAEEIFVKDLNWLGIKKISKTVFASDRLEIYYEYMRKTIEMGKAYICFCEKEKWKSLIDEGKACPHRELPPAKQMEEFSKMLSHKIKEGEAVLRLKTDLNANDPALKDWWMARIVDKVQHPRVGKKFHLWPSYNFASAIDDHLLGVTLIIRGQEHAQNETKQKYLYDFFGWTYPHTIHTGRISLGDTVLSKSKIKKGIDENVFTGWDDPRLGTITALRKRGFKPEAIIGIIHEIGAKTNDVNVSMEKIVSINKKLIDEESERFSFIPNPTDLEVEATPEMVSEKPIHPDFLEKGIREYEIHAGRQHFTVNKELLQKIGIGKVFRLRHCFNAKLLSIGDLQSVATFLDKTKIDVPIISWVTQPADAVVTMPDNSLKFGVIDADILDKKKGDRVQLEQFGYAIIEAIEKGRVKLNFTHE